MNEGRREPKSALERLARNYSQIRAQAQAQTPEPAKSNAVVQFKKRKSYTALMVPPGSVRLTLLDDPDWASQFWAFMHAYGRIRTDTGQKCSEKTYKDRAQLIKSVFMEMREKRNIKTLSQLRPKLLPAMFDAWRARGVSPRSMISYYNQLRWFWSMCGITTPPIKEFEQYEDEFTINRAASRDKSWTGNRIDIDKTLADIREIDPVAERLVIAMLTYGVRIKEALRMQPHEVDKENAIELTKGTKNGRPRRIDFEVFENEQAYREILDTLKDQVEPGQHLAWQNRTLEQARNRMYYIARKVGLTKKEAGATWHGLRTEWAIRQLEELTGTIAPVRGGIAINYKALSEVRRKVARGMGHNRITVTTAYYGSFLSMEREQARRFDGDWESIEEAMTHAGELLGSMEIKNLYWIGARALGAKVSVETPFEFALPPGTELQRGAQAITIVSNLVREATKKDCIVHLWDTMPMEKQMLWEFEAIPIFDTVSPKDLMLHRLQAQKEGRMANSK